MHKAGHIHDAIGEGRPRTITARLDVKNLIALAAAPTFAGMALYTAVDESALHAICSGSQSGATFGGMTAMYAMMTIFHLTPWLSLASANHDTDRLGYLAFRRDDDGTIRLFYAGEGGSEIADPKQDHTRRPT